MSWRLKDWLLLQRWCAAACLLIIDMSKLSILIMAYKVVFISSVLAREKNFSQSFVKLLLVWKIPVQSFKPSEYKLLIMKNIIFREKCTLSNVTNCAWWNHYTFSSCVLFSDFQHITHIKQQSYNLWHDHLRNVQPFFKFSC